MPFLAPLITGAIPWRLIGIAAGVAAVIGLVLMFVGAQRKIGRLEAQRDAAVATANANAAIAKFQRNQHALVLRAVDTNAAKKAALRVAYDHERRRIIDAPATDDGPLAPVLRRALDGLRGNQDDRETRSAPAGAGAGVPAAAVRGAGGARP